MPRKISLNELEFRMAVDSMLHEFGHAALNRGFDPVFVIEPGAPIRIELTDEVYFRTFYELKDDAPRDKQHPAPAPEAYPVPGLMEGCGDTLPGVTPQAVGEAVALLQTSAWLTRGIAPEAPAPEEFVRLVDPATGWTADLPAAPDELDNVASIPGGYAVHLDAEKPAVAIAEGPLTARALAGATALPWTEEENQTAVEMIAGGTPIEDVATFLGRPLEGLKFRMRTKLKDRLEEEKASRAARVARRAEIEAAAAADPIEEAPTPGLPAADIEEAPISEPDPVEPSEAPEAAAELELQPEPAAPEPLEAGGGSTPDVVVPELPKDALTAHLVAVKHDRVWTRRRDRDLLHFAELGWPQNDIALELQVPVAEVKPRFAILTARNTFKRAEVLARLELMLAPMAAA